MEAYEYNACSFVIKIWVEELDSETLQQRWRGHITHVFSGKRQYFEDLGMINHFMTPYLTQMGITNVKPDYHI